MLSALKHVNPLHLLTQRVRAMDNESISGQSTNVSEDEVEASPPQSPAQPAEERANSSLHYSLLGPSLLKAGQDGVDQTKVGEIIYNASVGSKFFAHEEKRDEQVLRNSGS